MKFITGIILSIFLVATALSQVDSTYHWKKLDTENKKKIWYDVSSIDTIKGDKFDIWVLEVHTPPMKSEGIEGEIYRSKILYAVNLTTVRYGIVKIRYYDVKNKELYAFDYDTPPPPTDALRYPYPVFEESPIYLIIKELFKYKKGLGN